MVDNYTGWNYAPWPSPTVPEPERRVVYVSIPCLVSRLRKSSSLIHSHKSCTNSLTPSHFQRVGSSRTGVRGATQGRGVILDGRGKCLEGVWAGLRGVEGSLKYRAELTMFVLYIGSLFEPVIFLNEILPRGPLQNPHHFSFFLLRPQWWLLGTRENFRCTRGPKNPRRLLRMSLRLKIASHSPLDPKLPAIHNLQRPGITLRLGGWGPKIAREIFPHR